MLGLKLDLRFNMHSQFQFMSFRVKLSGAEENI